jgi:ribosomally synthesized peptide (two-chain TOMM family)
VSDAAAALKQRFGYEWYWHESCELKLEKPPQSYEWVGDQWVWPTVMDEVLTLRVPLDPKKIGISDELQGEALADYYRQRPSLFDDSPQGAGKQPRPAIQPTEAMPSRAMMLTRADAVGNPTPAPAIPGGSFIPASNVFSSFTVALVAAMGRAWGDQNFQRTLLINSVTALAQIAGYNPPWEFRIAICEDTTSTWQKSTSGRGEPSNSKWLFTQKHTLQLFIPAKPPATVPSCEPLALAMYNATGAAFPFTCCAC